MPSVKTSSRVGPIGGLARTAVDNTPAFPLTPMWPIWGGLLGTVVGLVTGQFLEGYAVFVLVAGLALVWNRRFPPIFPFVIAYQWVAITIGYWYMQVVGDFPTIVPTGDIDRTILLSLTGLLLLALGIRVAWGIGQRVLGRRAEWPEVGVENLRRLFWLVLVLYAVDYVYVVNTKNFAGFDVLLDRVLDLRQIALLVLWFEVLRQRRGFTFLWLSLAFVFFPRLGSYFSDFKSPLFMLAVAFAAAWQPWRGPWWRLPVAGVKALPLAVVLVFLALIWQGGGVKKETRRAYESGQIGGDPLSRISLFINTTESAVPDVLHDPQPAIQELVNRLSYVTFFSRVLEHVPKREPFADGELLKMAIQNSVMPRFLFPDKAVLPSDSYYTRRFTGVMVNDTDTSISIGYMAEFYADWGTLGMFVSVFLFGCWIGICATIIVAALRTRQVAAAALVVIFMHVSEFEAQFIKTFAALNVSIVMIVGLLWLFRGRVAAILGLVGAPEAPAPADPQGAEVPA